MKNVRKQAKRTIDSIFLRLILCLLLLGLIMLWSSSYVISYYKYDTGWYFIQRQGLLALVGVIAMFLAARVDYVVYFKFAEYIYGLAVFLLCAVLFLPPVNGARRWIALGPGSFQPSEVAKFAVIVIVAKFVAFNKNRMNTFKYGVLKILVFMAIVAGLMILEPHISGTVLIFAIGAVMMFIGGTNMFWFVAAAGFLVGVVGVCIFNPKIASYAASRVEFWLDPFADPRGRGYQIIQSLLAIGSGGIFGCGIGAGKQKQLYLPEVHNDFVFSSTCEELGFVGATIIILLFALLVWRGFQIAKKTNDDFGRMLVVGIVTQVGLQAALNIAVVTNTIPSTGISMPFFSYGGTALLMLLAELGIVFSVDKFGERPRIYRV
ncbi:MAG: putative lipid II flippase FtsW [Oscillospiraceae bacterium]|jgi:cell division protein FtsW|nr:putative lipid II flippase FtsW [Oscillospiraceae bacterium]